MNEDKKDFTPRPDHILQLHESGVRSLVYGAHGIPYQPLHSLEEARTYPDGIVVFEGELPRLPEEIRSKPLSGWQGTPPLAKGE